MSISTAERAEIAETAKTGSLALVLTNNFIVEQSCPSGRIDAQIAEHLERMLADFWAGVRKNTVRSK